MTDTPDHIKELQLKTWLSKTPAERLRQFLIDNDTLMQFWDKERNDKSSKSQNDEDSIKAATLS